MDTVMVADPSAHAPFAYNNEKRCHFSRSPISDVETLDKGKAAVNGQFFEESVETNLIFLLIIARSGGQRDIYRILAGIWCSPVTPGIGNALALGAKILPVIANQETERV